MGKATATELLKRGSDVILACRSLQLAEEAALELKSLKPYDGCALGAVEVAPLDLARLQSVRDFVCRVVESRKLIHLLVCNAGIMAPLERHLTEDNFEQQFQVRKGRRSNSHTHQ